MRVEPTVVPMPQPKEEGHAKEPVKKGDVRAAAKGKARAVGAGGS
jgi:hypothetical protein